MRKRLKQFILSGFRFCKNTILRWIPFLPSQEQAEISAPEPQPLPLLRELKSVIHTHSLSESDTLLTHIGNSKILAVQRIEALLHQAAQEKHTRCQEKIEDIQEQARETIWQFENSSAISTKRLTEAKEYFSNFVEQLQSQQKILQRFLALCESYQTGCHGFIAEPLTVNVTDIDTLLKTSSDIHKDTLQSNFTPFFEKDIYCLFLYTLKTVNSDSQNVLKDAAGQISRVESKVHRFTKNLENRINSILVFVRDFKKSLLP